MHRGPRRMTLERRWLGMVIGLVGVSLALMILLGHGIGRFNAEYSARGWLSSTLGGPRARVLEHTFDDLEGRVGAIFEREAAARALDERDVEALAAALPPSVRSRWVVYDPSTRDLRSALAECDAFPSRDLPAAGPARAIVWCRQTPVLLARALEGRGGASLWLAEPLGQAFVDEVKSVSLHEIELWGPNGTIATTYALEDGSHPLKAVTPLDRSKLAEPGPQFVELELDLGGPYRGYFQQAEPDAWGKRMAETGRRNVRVFAFSRELDPTLAPADLRMVAAIPSSLMMLGPRISTMAMLAIGALLLVGVAVLARRLIRMVSRPLTELERAARAAATGDGDFRVPSNSGTFELASLSSSFIAILSKVEETQRRAAQSEKMAALGTLAGGVAHEINNPLGVILGFAQGLERRVPEGDGLRMPVTSIVREALRCKALVQELLAFSRVGKRTDEPIDVTAAVRSSLLLLGVRAKTQGVEIVSKLEDPLPRLRGSQTQLQQVIVNLGTNALDVMKSGGALEVRAYAEANDVVLEVADTGSGIPADIRGRIFEPFFTTKPVGEGTGLGLSLAYQICQQHHGRVDVASTGPTGTVMRVRLPVPRAPQVMVAA